MIEFWFFVFMPMTRTFLTSEKIDQLFQILFLFAWPPKQSENLTVSPAALQKPHSIFTLLDVQTKKKKTSQWASTCCFLSTAPGFMIFLDKQTTERGSPSFLRFFTRLSAPIISMKMSRMKRSNEGRVPGFNCNLEIRSCPLWGCISLVSLPCLGIILGRYSMERLA